jgi:ABC-type nitrate/sulfonate/bicarbonate transport system substrate-binding protein
MPPARHDDMGGVMNRSFIVGAIFLVTTVFHLSITPSAFAQLIRLKTSYSALTANMAAYWLAKDTKIFEKHGLDVDVVLLESGVTTVQALTAGETQIAMGGGTVAVSSNLAGSDIVSISSIESRLPYALLAQKEIKTIDQLKEKRLAISRFGSASDLGARLSPARLPAVCVRTRSPAQTHGQFAAHRNRRGTARRFECRRASHRT